MWIRRFGGERRCRSPDAASDLDDEAFPVKESHWREPEGDISEGEKKRSPPRSGPRGEECFVYVSFQADLGPIRSGDPEEDHQAGDQSREHEYGDRIHAEDEEGNERSANAFHLNHPKTGRETEKGHPAGEDGVGAGPEILVDREPHIHHISERYADDSRADEAERLLPCRSVRDEPVRGQGAQQRRSDGRDRAQDSFRIPCRPIEMSV